MPPYAWFLLGTIVAGIISFTLLIFFFKATRTDPFDIILFEKQDFFLNKTFLLTKTKQCKCGDDIVNDFCSEEQILSGCENISPTILSKKHYLRLLMDSSECNNITLRFLVSENIKEVFNINARVMHNMSIGIIVMHVVLFCVLGLLLFSIIYDSILDYLSKPINVLRILGILVNVILLIILFVKFFKGDILTYKDYLECPYVKAIKFENQFKGVQNIIIFFFTFLFFNACFLTIFILSYEYYKINKIYES